MFIFHINSSWYNLLVAHTLEMWGIIMFKIDIFFLSDISAPAINTNKFNEFYQKSKNHYNILYIVLSWKFFKDLRLNL